MTQVSPFAPACPELVEWPPEYSPDVLRANNPDLAGFDDDQMRTHYETYGRAEGRVAATPALREHLVAMIDPDMAILEIGPFCQPVFRGPNVRYMDMLDAAALRERALAIEIDPTNCPEVIHFVGDLSAAAGADFQVVFSSHNIEHQPDLVSHLQHVEQALTSGGVLIMLIPDKRYCFDHFLPETTLPEVLEAFAERRTRHSARHVIEHIALTSHNDLMRHWNGDHGPRPDLTAPIVLQAMRHYEAHQDIYIDVHAWKFTPTNFREIVGALHHHGLTGLAVERVYETPIGRNEFAAVLKVAAWEGRRLAR
jgi:SAM-dependent methyltransferase